MLLLHGFPQTSHSWRHVQDALAADGLRVVALDQRGYSSGARPAGVEPYAMRHLVADVLAALDALDAERVDVVGHDWGAAVAWQLAARHPERVRTLTAVSVPHPLAFAAALRHDPDQRTRSQYMRAFATAGCELTLLADGAGRLRALFDDAPQVDVEAVVAAVGDPAVLRHCLDWYAAASLADLDGLGAVSVPTMHVWSDADRALGRAGAEGTERYVEGPYRFEVLAGVSHWIPEQAADRLVELLREQLAAHPA